MNSGFVLFAHGGSMNHGCEALVRSTCGVIRNVNDSAQLYLISPSISEDISYLGEICRYKETKSGIRNLDFYIAYLKYRFSGDSIPLDTYQFRSVIKSLPRNSVAISIGGDNYCYGNTAYYVELNRLFRRAGHKTVLWGCSINEKAFEEKGVLDDLGSYSLITARESLTYGLLKSAGLNNVEMYPDPAFTLNADVSALPEYFKAGQTVGLNLSPMIQDNERIPGIVMQNYMSLVQTILDETECDIALIPHVIWPQSDDRALLKVLFDEFSSSGRVIMIEDNNAERLKGIISKCRFMIAARTHASIAAYSTGVPTLVVGYSIKAKGIAKDIFGSYDNYVLPVQELKESTDLIGKFRWMMDHESEIRNHLYSFMPGYVAKAWKAGTTLIQI